MRKMELFIGEVLRLGLILSVSIVLVGGILFLIQHGQEIVQYSLFQQPAESSKNTFFSPEGIILFGFLVLVAIQLVRVSLIVWLFLKNREFFFTGLSLFILVIIIYSLFWRR